MSDSDDRKDVGRVRKRAAKRAWTPERIVREIERADLFGRGILATCRAAKDEVVPGLLEAMRTRDGLARQQASVLLLHLGDPRGTKGIVEVLTAGDEQERIGMLAHLSVLPSREPQGQFANIMEPPVPIDREALERALVPLLGDATTHLGGLALEVLIRFATAAAGRWVAPLLDHADPAMRRKVIGWYAENGDPTALDPIVTMLLEEEDRTHDAWLLRSLEEYAGAADASLRGRAAETAAAFVRKSLDQEDNATANNVYNALRVIEKAAPEWEAALLGEVASSKVEAWAQSSALERLASLQKEQGDDRLVAALARPDLRAGAAKTLGERRGDASRIRAPLVRALEEELGAGEPSTRKIGEIANALAARGFASDPILDRAMAHLDPWDRTRIVWLREGIRPRDIVERLVRAGIVPTIGAEEIDGLERKWDESPEPASLVLSLFGEEDRCVAFDTESALVPPDYVELVNNLGRISRGALAIECAVQDPIAGHWEPGGEDGPVVVEFVDRDRVVRFQAEQRGDWFDVPATLAALDRAIETAGRPERFFALHTGDQLCFLICTDGGSFRDAAASLGIPYEEDADAAMRSGVEFENHVRAELADEKA